MAPETQTPGTPGTSLKLLPGALAFAGDCARCDYSVLQRASAVVPPTGCKHCRAPEQVRVLPVPQQGCDMPPQAVHMSGALPAPAAQFRFAPQPLFVPLEQQRWLAPPQASQIIDVPEAPPAPPAPPAPLVCLTQAPPVWQMSPAQHAPFSAPQFEHMRGAFPGGFSQARPVAQVLLSQQICVFAPHGVHMPAPPPLVSQTMLAPHSD